MTDEERTELDASANWVMIPNEEVSNAVTNVLRWGAAPLVVRLINNKNEGEIYNLLDFWYKFDNSLSREQFVENVIHLAQHEKLDITSQQIEWINRWVNSDSPIVRAALKNPKLRMWFDEQSLERVGVVRGCDLLRDYIRYCETVNTSEMARAAETQLPNHCGKELHRELAKLKVYGLRIGGYTTWSAAQS